MFDPFLSVISSPDIVYPAADDFFSPNEAYPEYRYATVSGVSNPVYRAVRNVFAQAGLDKEYLGKADWNPLAVFIPPGSRVFVLCNFVYHRRLGEDKPTFWAKCTHGSVLRAVLDYVLIATGPEGRVLFGNAPLQSCDWNAVLRDSGAQCVLDFYRERDVDVQAHDLRRFTALRNLLGGVKETENRELADVVEFDLGRESLLAQLDSLHPRYRVTDYNPRRTEYYQDSGRHVYAVNREILETDVIFSVPKLKTHEKVGITCNLKGMVGTIALKDCLAHHRFGSPREGGDEYPESSRVLHMLSEFHEGACTNGRAGSKANLKRIVDVNLRRIAVRSGKILAGAWYGNDTAWRMALDIARVVTYGDADGRLHTEPQRKHIGLVDGIVGGEGDGPLDPRPVPSGTLIFSDDLVLGDRACCAVMGIDPEKIPLVREGASLRSFPIAKGASDQVPIYINGSRSTLAQLSALCRRPFLCPRGWRRHLAAAV